MQKNRRPSCLQIRVFTRFPVIPAHCQVGEALPVASTRRSQGPMYRPGVYTRRLRSASQPVCCFPSDKQGNTHHLFNNSLLSAQ